MRTKRGQNRTAGRPVQVLLGNMTDDRAPEGVVFFVAFLPDTLELVEVVLNQAIRKDCLNPSLE
jgi:hypothetical protein